MTTSDERWQAVLEAHKMGGKGYKPEGSWFDEAE